MKVCFVGASHSRFMNDFCKKILTATPGISTGNENLVECSWLSYVYPRNQKSLENDCTHAVVGIFQWHFSAKNPLDDVTFPEWTAHMTKAVERLVEEGRTTSLRKILLRSLHPNPMGHRHSVCPPIDFRTLTTAEKATSIVEEIARSYHDDDDLQEPADDSEKQPPPPSVGFVDTRFIMDPVWDSSRDCGHCSWEAGETETKFILSEILRDEWG